jgi:CRISPR system Cascade subunit CasA
MKHNLLTDPLIRVLLPGKIRTTLTLPALLAELYKNDIESFIGLQPHQSHAWHAFLVQLAAIAIHDHVDFFDKTCTEMWHKCLLNLTKDSGGEAAWCLIHSQLTEPAFMQPPIPENCLKKFDSDINTPDGLDILATARNHDLKQQRIIGKEYDHWIYALITLQTMQGVYGSGNYGIYRMNTGYGNRPCVSYAPSYNFGARFRRDVSILCRSRAQICNDNGYLSENGIKLIWTVPWDGKASLSFDQLDPYFIEICRRIRLVEINKKILAFFKTSKQYRILRSDEFSGNTGDPWTPVAKNGKSLTIAAKGFSYEDVCKLLFSGEFKQSICQNLQSDDPNELSCIMQALARGKGITEGLHERYLPISSKVRSLLFNPQERLNLSSLAQRRIEEASNFRKEVLRIALFTFFQKGSTDLKFSDSRAEYISKILKTFDESVDSIFFPFLWDHLETDPDLVKRTWTSCLKDIAWKILQEVISHTVSRSALYYKATSEAEKVFSIRAAKFN